MAKQLNLRLPPTLREQAQNAAQQEGVSVNQFCTLAIARAIGESHARAFFRKRGQGLTAEAGQQSIARVLSKVRK